MEAPLKGLWLRVPLPLPAPAFSHHIPRIPLAKGAHPPPCCHPILSSSDSRGKSSAGRGIRARPFPLGDPPHPHPSSAPPRSCPVPLPARFLTPKPFPAGGLKKAFWGGVFLGGQILLNIPLGRTLVPNQTPPPPRALPVGFHFWGYFLGGVFCYDFQVAVQVLHVFAPPSRKFSDSCIYLFYMGTNRNPQKRTCEMFFVHSSSVLFRGEGDLSVETVLVLSRLPIFFGFLGFFSNDYFFIVLVKMSVAFQVSVSLAMK